MSTEYLTYLSPVLIHVRLEKQTPLGRKNKIISPLFRSWILRRQLRGISNRVFQQFFPLQLFGKDHWGWFLKNTRIFVYWKALVMWRRKRPEKNEQDRYETGFIEVTR